MSGWDAVKQRYGYKEISIATWRDPKLSVHPARGGPRSPTISPESASRPFIPKYKVRYPVPEPTDDEDSEHDAAEEETKTDDTPQPEEVHSASSVEEPSADAGPSGSAEKPAEPEPADPNASSDASEPKPVQEIEASKEETPVDSSSEPPGDSEPAASSPEEVVPVEEVKPGEQPPAPSDTEPTLEASDADKDEPGTADDTASSPAPEPPGSFPPVEHDHNGDSAESANDDQDSVEIANEQAGEAVVEKDAPGAIPPEAPEPPLPDQDSGEHADEQAGEAVVGDDEDDNEKKSVQWAPGTPEPKPTKRPKKAAKGAKGKKKKVVATTVDDGDPDEIIAIVEGPGDIPQDIVPIEVPIAEEPNEVVEPVEQSIIDAPAKEEAIVEVVEHAPPAKPDVSNAKSKKKDKKSSKNKSKSKAKESEPVPEPAKPSKKSKKSSKSEVKDAGPPLGLGIDFGDPASATAIAEDLPSPPESTEDAKSEDLPTSDSIDEVVPAVEETKPAPGAEVTGAQSAPDVVPDDDACATDIDHNDASESKAVTESSIETTSEVEVAIVEVIEESEGASDDVSQTAEEVIVVENGGDAESAKEEDIDEVVTPQDSAVDLGEATETSDVREGEEGLPSEDENVQDTISDTAEAESPAPEDSSKQIPDMEEDKATLPCEDNEDGVNEPDGDIQADDDINPNGDTKPDDVIKPDDEIKADDDVKADDDLKAGDDVQVDEQLPDLVIDVEPQEEHELTETQTVEPNGEGGITDKPEEDEQNAEIEATEEASEPPDEDSPASDEQVVHGSAEPNEEAGEVPIPEPLPEATVEDLPVEDAEQSKEVEAVKSTPAQEEQLEVVVVSDAASDIPVIEAANADKVKPADILEAEPAAQIEQSQEDATVEIPNAEVEHDSVETIDTVQKIAAPDNAEELANPGDEEDSKNEESTAGPPGGQASKDGGFTETHVPDTEPVPEAMTGEPAVEPKSIDADAMELEPSDIEPVQAQDPEPPHEEALQAGATPSLPESGVEHVPETTIESNEVPEKVVVDQVDEAKEETSPIADTPPSPTLSRRSKPDHWERSPKKPSSEEKKKEKSRSSKHSSRRSRSEKSRSLEDDVERQRRREARKALEAARIYEEERRLAEEEELRQIRHEARRAARKAAAAEATRIAREEAEAIAREDAERRRRKRESYAERPRSQREIRSSSAVPKLFGISRGTFSRTDSAPVRTSKYSSRRREDERPRSRRLSSSPAEILVIDDVIIDAREETPVVASSSQESSSHRRHRHHRHRTDSDRTEQRRHESDRPRSSRKESDRKDGERRSKKSAAPEQKSKGFFGSLFR